MPRNSLWKRLEEIKVHFKLRSNTKRLYENVFAKFKNIEGWFEDINCNIAGVKKGCLLSPSIFGISINKLEGCLVEEVALE